MTLRAAGVMMASITISAPATAASYDLAGDFGASVFAYGTISSSGAFAGFGAADCSAIGITSTCYRGGDTYQVIARRDASSVLVHPGPEAADTTAVTFTAPAASTYRFSIDFGRGDTGDGVGINAYVFGSLLPITQIGSASPVFSVSFSLALAAKQTIGFALHRGPVDYFYDSTFVSGAIASVPEPATWGMMILGVGLVGGLLRRRIRRSEARFTERLRRIEAGDEQG